MSTKDKKATTKKTTKKEEEPKEEKKRATSPRSPRKKAPKKKPEFRKSEYSCAICDEEYKSGTKHWKQTKKTNIPGTSISQNTYNITKELNEKYDSKDAIPKTKRLCNICYKEKVVPNLPKREKKSKDEKTKK